VRSAVPFSRAAGLEIHVREGLRERAFVMSREHDFLAVWERSWDDYDYALPGCETNRQAELRIVQAVRAIVSASDADIVGICSHGAVIGLLLHSLDPGVGRDRVERLRNPDVIKILVHQDAWTWDRDYELPGLGNIATPYAG
jgi:2,3-bisphosphoglycerate-dependent phosphoglycerate mutase